MEGTQLVLLWMLLSRTLLFSDFTLNPQNFVVLNWLVLTLNRGSTKDNSDRKTTLSTEITTPSTGITTLSTTTSFDGTTMTIPSSCVTCETIIIANFGLPCDRFGCIAGPAGSTNCATPGGDPTKPIVCNQLQNFCMPFGCGPFDAGVGGCTPRDKMVRCSDVTAFTCNGIANQCCVVDSNNACVEA